MRLYKTQICEYFRPAHLLRRSTSFRLWGQRLRHHNSSSLDSIYICAVIVVVVALRRWLYPLSQLPPNLLAQLIILPTSHHRIHELGLRASSPASGLS